MAFLSLFRKIHISDPHIKETLKIREMKMENTINKFRMILLGLFAAMDLVTYILGEIMDTPVNYDITEVWLNLSSIPMVLFFHFMTRGKTYHSWIKYMTVTLDLAVSFAFAYWMVTKPDFPFPISKISFALLMTMIFTCFNSLSILRSDKIVLMYSSILTIIFNIIVLEAVVDNSTVITVYTSSLILLMGLFYLWVSEHIIKFHITNNLLNTANTEIIAQNAAITQQNEEIEAQSDEIKAQRDLVMEQRDHIELINREVTDSIHYAKRIQSAILPVEEDMKRLLGEFFVLFRPKDIVSGDFYWIAHIEDKTIIAVADCTGHGVPGAFMSMLGAAFLNEIVNKEYVTHTGVILRKLRKEIIRALQQKGEAEESASAVISEDGGMVHNNMKSVKDGMDIALCSINKDKTELQFSGAYNPLYLIRDKNLAGPENMIGIEGENAVAYEIKADKMPIAIYEKLDNFADQVVPLCKGDSLYLFSDGFADQFGGSWVEIPRGKKFKSKNFKNLLLNSWGMPMKEQQKTLNNALDSWMNMDKIQTAHFEQVDDITVLGWKIE